jgi:hypothetical protein
MSGGIAYFDVKKTIRKWFMQYMEMVALERIRR